MCDSALIVGSDDHDTIKPSGQSGADQRAGASNQASSDVSLFGLFGLLLNFRFIGSTICVLI